MLADEVHEAVHGIGFGDVELDGGLADVEVDLAGRAAHVAEVRVRHLAGAVHDAAHDGDLHAFEVLGAGLDARGDGLEVEERAPAARAGHVVGLEAAATGGLEDVVGEAQAHAGTTLATHENGVTNAIGEEGADVHGGAEEGDFRFEDGRPETQAVLQQDRIAAAEAVELRDEQAEGGDGREVHAILHGDELRVAIDVLDAQLLRRVEFEEVQVLVDAFGLHVVLGADLWRDLVEGGTGDDDADGLLAAALRGVAEFGFRSGAALEVEGVEGEGRSRREMRVGRWELGEGRNLREQIVANLNLSRAVFRQRDADGVAEPIAQQ